MVKLQPQVLADYRVTESCLFSASIVKEIGTRFASMKERANDQFAPKIRLARGASDGFRLDSYLALTV